MRIFLEENALTYAYYDNYPLVTFRVESGDLEEMTDKVRTDKGYAPLFDYSHLNAQLEGWYDFYIIVNCEKEIVTSLWAEVHGDVDEEVCPDYEQNTYLEYDSADLIRQIKEQLKNRYDMVLTDLKEEVMT